MDISSSLDAWLDGEGGPRQEGGAVRLEDDALRAQLATLQSQYAELQAVCEMTLNRNEILLTEIQRLENALVGRRTVVVAIVISRDHIIISLCDYPLDYHFRHDHVTQYFQRDNTLSTMKMNIPLIRDHIPFQNNNTTNIQAQARANLGRARAQTKLRSERRAASLEAVSPVTPTSVDSQRSSSVSEVRTTRVSHLAIVVVEMIYSGMYCRLFIFPLYWSELDSPLCTDILDS